MFYLMNAQGVHFSAAIKGVIKKKNKRHKAEQDICLPEKHLQWQFIGWIQTMGNVWMSTDKERVEGCLQILQHRAQLDKSGQ